MVTGKKQLDLINRILVFDAKSFEREDSYGVYIPTQIHSILNKLSREYNVIAIYPKENLAKKMYKKITGQKKARVFPAVKKECDFPELLRLLTTAHHSPFIYLQTISKEFVSVPIEKRIPFMSNVRDFGRILLNYDFENAVMPYETAVTFDAEKGKNFRRRIRTKKFEDKFHV